MPILLDILSKQQECIGTFFQDGTFVQIGARYESHSKREHESAYQSSEGISGMYYGSGGVSHCGIDVFEIWYSYFSPCILVLNNFLIIIFDIFVQACGRRNTVYGNVRAKTRIVGGVESAPGDWPFLAALLGGPEQIFYCAGVLIADQWVLTASHCVGK